MESTKTLEEALTINSLVLADFWAEWCGPCRMMNPVIERIKNEYAGRVEVVKVNADLHPELTEQYGVQSLPTLIFMKNKEVVLRIVGMTPEVNIKGNLDKMLG